jgi:hypothetical protein
MLTKKQHENALALIQKWDAGETISTIEMSGLGPGYEQALQTCAVEFVRVASRQPIVLLPSVEEWSERWDNALHRFDEALGGLSGAQVGAAKALARAFLEEGPDLSAFAKEKGITDRSMFISNHWPDVNAARKANS